MFGYGPKLPLARDPIDGFLLTKSLQENIEQNLKNILLTSPGERIMIPDFGVGIRRYLFEQRTNLVIEQIRQRIHSQVETYMPFVAINNLFIGTSATSEQTLLISIEYSVLSLNLSDVLSLTVSA